MNMARNRIAEISKENPLMVSFPMTKPRVIIKNRVKKGDPKSSIISS